jgi:hypothetical protein
LGTFFVNFVIENCCFSILGIHGGAGGLDEPDCIGEGTEISDRTKETIAGLQKNITRIITLSNEDLQVLFFMSPNRLIQ